VAALNQSPDTAAAAPFVRVLGELWGPRVEDSSIGMPAAPLDELFGEPARRAIEARGGVIVTKAVARVACDTAGVIAGVQAGSLAIESSRVIAAVPWHALAGLWPAGVPAALATVADRAAAMEPSPIVTVNVWADGAVLPAPYVGFAGGPMHWVFDKGAIFGRVRPAATAGAVQHWSVVASGAGELTGRSNEEIGDTAVAQLSRTVALDPRGVRRTVVVRERRATFSLAPGAPPRPGAATPVPGLFLAGDWTDTGLPATIEGAVLSGRRAADAVLSRGRAAGQS
jgi:hypothetical protein